MELILDTHRLATQVPWEWSISIRNFINKSASKIFAERVEGSQVLYDVKIY
ncbi:hypothetical protein QM027_05855 [Campylobacter concisus]